MMTVKDIKTTLRSIRQYPAKSRHYFFQQFPQLLGHQVIGCPVQLYRNDDHFKTLVSFNNFIEFFSNISKMDISIQVEAFSHGGSSLGVRRISINSKGACQFDLSDLFPHLDQFGMFSVKMKVHSKFIQELAYLGSLHPQFMTIFVPKNPLDSPQMIHSHKLKQGRILFPRTMLRGSSAIESNENLRALEFYFVNSSASRLQAKLNVMSADDGNILFSQTISIPGNGVMNLPLDLKKIKGSQYKFEYQFDRNVDHKKPILFREFEDGSLSCNHT